MRCGRNRNARRARKRGIDRVRSSALVPRETETRNCHCGVLFFPLSFAVIPEARLGTHAEHECEITPSSEPGDDAA